MTRRALAVGGIAAVALGAGAGLQVPATLEGGGFRWLGGTAGGGGVSEGGGLRLSGVVPAPSTGLSAGGAFILFGGVLGVFREPNPNTVARLRATLTPDHAAILEWSADTGEYVLEFSSSVGPDAVWTPVNPQPTGTTFTTPCQQPARFFRLRRP